MAVGEGVSGPVPRSRHSDLKGGRIIVLQNTNLPLSTDFSMEKKTPIFQNADC